MCKCTKCGSTDFTVTTVDFHKAWFNPETKKLELKHKGSDEELITCDKCGKNLTEYIKEQNIVLSYE